MPTPTSRGKVRDIYDLGPELLLVATDRISAFDHVLPDDIPFKGEVLTKLSLFWFDILGDTVPNHLVSARVEDLPTEFAGYAEHLAGRFLLVKKAKVFPVECIVRGYLTGSGLIEYQAHGTVCGIDLPRGLMESSRLKEPIFTPSTKAEIGSHDENIPYERMVEIVGEKDAAELKRISLDIYTRAREHAAKQGIIIADTKFEFGVIDGEISLVDEVLTPDSSRFWSAADYVEGRVQASFDKQFVRNWLTRESEWDKNSEPPHLPARIIQATSEKYIQAYERITGTRFIPEGQQ